LTENVGGTGGGKYIYIDDCKNDPISKIKWDSNRYGMAYIGKEF
jgi:hypothetical protein